MLLGNIISGGQTGVDRAALDASIAASVPYSGWCPKGGWAEDFPAPPGLLVRYPQLRETESGDPGERTEWNVRDSDAVLILLDSHGAEVSAGTLLTVRLTSQYGKPCLCLNVNDGSCLSDAYRWLVRQGAGLRVNVAGPRESEASGIYSEARRFMADLLLFDRQR